MKRLARLDGQSAGAPVRAQLDLSGHWPLDSVNVGHWVAGAVTVEGDFIDHRTCCHITVGQTSTANSAKRKRVRRAS